MEKSCIFNSFSLLACIFSYRRIRWFGKVERHFSTINKAINIKTREIQSQVITYSDKVTSEKECKSSVASIGKGDPFRKNHSFLSATISEILTCWEYPKPTPNWEFPIFLQVSHIIPDACFPSSDAPVFEIALTYLCLIQQGTILLIHPPLICRYLLSLIVPADIPHRRTM